MNDKGCLSRQPSILSNQHPEFNSHGKLNLTSLKSLPPATLIPALCIPAYFLFDYL